MASTGVDPYQGLFGVPPTGTTIPSDQQQQQPDLFSPYTPDPSAQQQQSPLSMRNLMDTYLKSQGINRTGSAGNALAGLVGMNPQSAVQSALAGIGSTVGGSEQQQRQALLDQLTTQATAQKQNKNLSAAKAAGIDLSGVVAKGAVKSAPQANAAGVQQWFNDYVTPYIADQQARMSQAADLYEQTMNEIVPYLNPARQQIALNYMPLIVAAYRQKAAQFPTQFLTGNGAGSMIGMLLQNSKRNSTILNYLNQQTQTPSNISGGSGGGGNFAALLQQAGVPTGG